MWSALMLYNSFSGPRPRHGATGRSPSCQRDSMNGAFQSGEVTERSPGRLRFHCAPIGSATKQRASAQRFLRRIALRQKSRRPVSYSSKPANTMTATSRVSRSSRAKAGDELTFDGHALESGGKKAAAAMNDENLMALLRERPQPAARANAPWRHLRAMLQRT